MNVLKPHLQSTVFTLLGRNASQREIHRLTGVDRKTIRRYRALLLAGGGGKFPRGGDHRLGERGQPNSPTPTTGC